MSQSKTMRRLTDLALPDTIVVLDVGLHHPQATVTRILVPVPLVFVPAKLC